MVQFVAIALNNLKFFCCNFLFYLLLFPNNFDIYIEDLYVWTTGQTFGNTDLHFDWMLDFKISKI